MIVGIGVDIVELDRMARSMKQPRFLKRLLTDAEYELSQQYPLPRQIEFVSGRFAAKEAYAKAIGTGIAHGLSWRHIEILPDETGRPVMTAPFVGKIHVSISHSQTYAIAQVILEEEGHHVSS
ncbi:holo-acyl-carrier-protein synthase [Exiguobacterium sp. AT1b]|uniref:Holo-[acyl-carrier-protein] synthase n=1 Tax=Exiguobacterium sp. (strain ATCC BAA-1283 / AT1b) TaxID=360911 RepID=ACPS_EXISA|nr:MULTISPECIES: holo-ACP synthase [unclassified Exiguobacterium]C4L132.1 RecName: Full=Holo-[acyl-carrier-protein] synthase; Short=Holo-ACP synthase; AltName: Full=4'-phosphopantetheinyl transferase AcpS [Exiguobacterium sp. AT1b]ACQ70995.1 holo-acyl-carrier-protein synthase [Exiguobacterium sp. AT1b]